MNTFTGTQIETSNSFKKAYKKLDSILRYRVDRFVEKLRNDPSLGGLNIERVRGASDNVRSCRVTKGVRIIYEIVQLGSIRLLYIGNHDAAYRKGVYYWLMLNDRGEPEETPAEDMGGFGMFETSDIQEKLREDLSSVLLGTELSQNLVGTIVDLISQTLIDGTDGKALPSSNATYENQGPINVIPAGSRGACKSILLAFCFDGDSFADRLREVAYHAGIHCPDTKLLILITSQWNPKEWKKNHEKAFADLKATRLIYFAGFGRLVRIA